MNVNHYFKKIVLGLGIALIVGAGFFLFSQKTNAQNEAVCTIKNAVFEPFTPVGTHLKNFYKEDSPPPVKIHVTTENCKDKEIFIGLYEGTSDVVTVKNVRGEQKIPGPFKVPDIEKITITLRPGEARCNTNTDPDCEYFIKTYYGTLLGEKSEYVSKGNQFGELNYDCDGVCDSNWLYVTDTSKKDSSAVELEDGQILGSASEACARQGEDCYELYGGLADAFGNKITTISTTSDDGLGGFLNMIIAFATGIAGIIVVARIFYLGIEYITSRNQGNEKKVTSVKEKILKTLLGLVLLLGIYVILRTINPDLLNLTPRMDSIRFETGGDPVSSSPQDLVSSAQTFKQFAAAHGITCPGSGGASAIPTIAKSFQGKITYSMTKRGKACEANTFCLDCSLFVYTVYTCAGLLSPGSTTAGIFPRTERITKMTNTTVNDKPLKPGDLLGWMSKSIDPASKKETGHVIMYIGNGQSIETTSGNKGRDPGKAVQIHPVTSYGNKLMYIKRAP